MEEKLCKLTSSDGKEYTIPRKNLKALAIVKLMDLKIEGVDLSNDEKVIEFFNKIGIEVE